MECYIIGVVLIPLAIFILKQTQYKVGFGNAKKDEWKRIKLKIWVLILIVTIGLLPIANIAVFIVFLFCYIGMLFEKDIRLSLTPWCSNRFTRGLIRILSIEF